MAITKKTKDIIIFTIVTILSTYLYFSYSSLEMSCKDAEAFFLTTVQESLEVFSNLADEHNVRYDPAILDMIFIEHYKEYFHGICSDEDEVVQHDGFVKAVLETYEEMAEYIRHQARANSIQKIVGVGVVDKKVFG